jgi:hypothetical protein
MAIATTTNSQVEEQLDKVVQLTRIERQTVEVPIVGVSPLIPHRWSEKAKRQMREKQSSPTRMRAKLGPKDAAGEAEASLYRLADGRECPQRRSGPATIGGSRFYGKDLPWWR